MNKDELRPVSFLVLATKIEESYGRLEYKRENGWFHGYAICNISGETYAMVEAANGKMTYVTDISDLNFLDREAINAHNNEAIIKAKR